MAADRHGRGIAASAAALLFAATLSMPAGAWQVTPPDAATRAAMDKRVAARTLLSSAIARIASNPSDSTALLDAGRASIDLEDYRAALGFLLRAEQARPRDAAVKAALGSAMVHLENPTRALDYFGEAQLLGAPERIFLADRGLARDLLGQQDAAQRDYQLALSIGANDEVTRRFALSLGISGQADRAVQLLSAQLRAQDRGAWRLRAMILAINGREREARDIVNATMPAALAENILPYLVQLNRLNPAQQAAAAHFGRFPAADAGRTSKAVTVAAKTPPPASSPAPSRRVPATGAGDVSASARIAAAAPNPASALPARTAPPQASTASLPPPRPVPATSTAGASDGARTPAPPPRTAPPPAPAAPATNSRPPAVPGFALATLPAAPTRPAAAPTPTPAASASATGSLADIVGSLEIPAEELARPDNAVSAETLARLQQDKRKAEAAEAARREKEEAAARVKAEAEAKAKAEAAIKKANPARQWVQIATGANLRALAFDFNRFAKTNAELFKGKAGATAEWGRTRRLLVGPFKDKAAAQQWLAGFKKAEGDGFLFASEAGEIVETLK